MFLSLDWSYPEAPSNNTHPYPAECDEMDRGEWLRALDKLEALHTKTVAAGHDVPAPDSSLRHIEETRAYLRDSGHIMGKTSTAIALRERRWHSIQTA